MRRDTLAGHSDTLTTRRDSLIRLKPIPLIGALEPYHDSTESILGSEIPWIEYRYLGDILWTKPGMYIRDMGNAGQRNELTIGGVDWRGIAFLVDGRSQSDPITGTFDMILFPTDYAERVEFITGPRAMLYGMNSTGGAINVVTKSFYTNTPYSRLRYSQGVDGYAQTDALFSQNVLPRFNLMFGLTRHTTGELTLNQDYRSRFPNADHDQWTTRTKLRYDLSNSFNIVFTHLYDQTETGLYGGVDYQKTPDGQYFDDYGAVVSNYDAYEKVYNHHLDLTAAAHLFGDTTQVSTITAYYSNQLREYRNEERNSIDFPFDGNFVQADHHSSTEGLLLRHSMESNFQNFSFTLQSEEIRVLSSPDVGSLKEFKQSASAKEEVRLLDPFTFAVFGRMDRYRGENIPGIGTDAQLSLNSSFTLFGGASVSRRTPTLQELYWSSDSSNIPTPRLWLKDERHTLFEAGVRFSIQDFISGTISVTHRVIKDPILIDTVVQDENSPLYYNLQFTQPPSQTYNGVNISMSAHYDHYFAEGNATYLKQPDYYHGGEKLTLFPQLYLDGSVYYRNVLVNGHLQLKIGFRGRYTSEQTGEGPLDESGIYVPYTLLKSFGPSETVDFFLIGKIGDAYLHFIWENLSGNQYMLTPFYPMYERNVRFGVSWEFWN
ncbi:MAG TPA: putative porin [Bacteroidota bacterium]|nr:putative porin [Bacteroidota bacterium]